MIIRSVFDAEFAPYGRLLDGGDFTELLEALRATEKPAAGVSYVPSCPDLEAVGTFEFLRDSIYGGMPIQIGCCCGTNTRLNCLEYHRDSEVNVTCGDIVLLVARQQDLVCGKLDTHRVEAFRLPAGMAVELYATTLHYAPCDGARGQGFQVAVVLPRGTNTDKPAIPVRRTEDNLLWARNKWLIAHPDADEAMQGAFIGLDGENPDIAPDI